MGCQRIEDNYSVINLCVSDENENGLRSFETFKIGKTETEDNFQNLIS